MSGGYVFDTSAWIGWWHEIYPVSIFPDICALIEFDVDARTIVSPVEVRTELEDKIDDDLTHWVKQRSGLFIPTHDQSQEIIAEVSNQCPKLLKHTKKTNADPAVVAWALQKDQIVVTQESHKKQTGIVACCRHKEVVCISLSKYVTERGTALDSIRKSLWGRSR